MAQDFSALLAAEPDAASAPQQTAPQTAATPTKSQAPTAQPAAAKPANDFSALLAAEPDAPQQDAGNVLFDSLIHQESRGRQLDAKGAPITSKKGAIGIAQVMPDTAKEAAALAGVPFDDMKYRTDAEYNKTLGRAYFNKQLADFQDPVKALAAYNAGPGAVRNALASAQKNGNPDGWFNLLPAETRAYVPAILNRAGKNITNATALKSDTHSNSYTEPVKPSGWTEDLTRGLKHGTMVTLPKAIGEAAKFFGAEDTGNQITKWAESNENSGNTESEYGQSQTGPWSVRGSVYEAADNSMLSLAPGAAGAAAGFALGGPLGALVGYGMGSLASLPIFYGSQGQQTYEKVKKAQLEAGASPEVAEQMAREAGHLSGFTEAGGEVVQDVIPFAKLFKPFAKPAAKATGTVVKDMFFPTIKQAAKGIAKTEVGEVGTEMGQQAGEAAVEGAYGAGPGATWSDTASVIMPTALMTLVPGLAGAAGKHAQVSATRRALENNQTDPDTRAKLASAAAHEMSKVSEDTSRNFALYAAKQIKDGAPIQISDDAFYAAQAAQISPETRVDPSLQPVAQAAAAGGSLSKAAMAGVTATQQQQQNTVTQTQVDPAARLAELEAIGKDQPDTQQVGPDGKQITVPGQKARFFTPEEKAEYDHLKSLREATPGMSQEDRDSAKPQVDEILDRAKAIEDATRTNNGLAAFRREDAPVNAKQFLNDLAIAKSKSTNAATREQALSRLEFAAEWAGFNVGQAPARQSTEVAGPPTRTDHTMGMATEAGLSQQDRSEVIASMATWRNPRLLPAQRQQALSRALEIIGRTQAGKLTTRPSQQSAAVLGDISGTESHFLREAERYEDGAYQFMSLGFDQEAQELKAQADSLREKAASARAGELGQELSAEEPVDNSSPRVQQTVAQATENLPRVEIPPLANGEKPTADNTAARRKRSAQIAQLAGVGFETVERRGKDFFLINSKTGQEVQLEGPADAQMARAAIAKAVNDRAHTAAASPKNDRLEPTEAQIAAGNYKKSDVIDLNGMKIVIENPAGSTRRGTSPDGKAWETTMAHHYGEFLGTEGADGDRLDVFIGSRPDSSKIYVIDQVNPDGSFDEHKVVMGATSEQQARETYLSNYEKGWTGLGAITEMSPDEFRAWAKSDRAKQPLMLGKEKKLFTVSENGNPVQLMALDTSEVGDASAPRAGKGKFISKKDADLLKAIGKIFGVNVQFFRPVTPGFSGDGFFNGGNTLYVNERTTISPLAVFGHELMHRIKDSNQKAYESIAKVVRANVKDAKGYRNDYYGKEYAEQHGDAPLTDAELEEMVSDLHGNLMTDSKFWGDVFRQIAADHGKEAKGIIAKLQAFLTKTIDTLVNSLKGQNFNAGQFVNNMKDVRAAFRDGLAQYMNESGVGKAAMQAEILRAGQKEKGESIKRSTPKPTDGISVEGYHFSQQPRATLTTEAFGTGLKGSARDEIMAHPDKRLRQRLSFYVDKGTGIRPEAGVGGIAHKATLTNLYDADTDKLRLRSADARAFESKVLDHGYSGYVNRMDGDQPGQAILLGKQAVTPEILGSRTSIEGARRVEAPAAREMDLGDKIMANRALPGGSMTPSRWAEVLMQQMPAEAAQLMDVGALGTEPLYKDELAAKLRKLQPEIKKSAQRAQQEYDEVVAQYKGTDKWLKAPNGKITHLGERQWVQVRTPSFKSWFGDWEKFATMQGTVWNDGNKEVSKVVDENGEPLVVYHGTDKGGFMEFKESGGKKRGDLGVFTTSNEEMAASYVRKGRPYRVADPEQGEQTGWKYISNKTGEIKFQMQLGDSPETIAEREKTNDAKAVPLYGKLPVEGEQRGIYALFLNIRDPQEENYEGASWSGERFDQYEVFDENDDKLYNDEGRGFLSAEDAHALADANPGAEVRATYGGDVPTTDTTVYEARKYGNDGVIIREVMDDGGGNSSYTNEPSDVFVAFDPSQMKSADFNGGEFSTKSNDIRRSRRREDFENPNARTEVSTTVPSAKKAGKVVNDAVNEKWVIDAEDVAASDDHRKAAIAAIKQYNAATVTNSKKAIQELHDIIVDNLVWLHDKMPPEIRRRAKLWYDGANRIATEMAKKYSLDERQTAGVLAVLSPQKDWFMNVSLGERLIKIAMEHGDEAWNPAMTAWVRSYVEASKDVETKGKRMALLKDAERLEGTAMADMNDRDAARFIRVFDETYHPRSYRVVTPEGGFGDFVTKGEEVVENEDPDADLSNSGDVAWGSYPTIEKGVSILRNADEENLFRNLSEALGNEHKVRNFYNNIIRPNSADGHVTIDTHAVAAAFFKALSGNAIEVMHNFGTTPKGQPGAGANAATGASGLYGIFADAYRDAASKAGVLAREMQSITWEAIRSIFQPGFKATRAKEVEAIFNRYKRGEITREQARQEAYDLGGGIKAMPWEGTPEGRFVVEGGTSFDGQIASEPGNRAARLMDPENTKDKLTINLSATTAKIPGLEELAKAANSGDVLAQTLLQDIGLDNLRHLLSGTSAVIKSDRVTGLYFNEVEPSLGLSVSFNEEDKDQVLAAIAKFAENFRQDAVHVRRPLPNKVKPLTEFGDGSFATRVYRWDLKKALSRKQIQAIIDKSGLAGLTFADGYVETYFVGDPTNDQQTIQQQADDFFQRAEVAGGLLSRAGGKVSRQAARLWSYGSGYGTRIGYAAIHGDVSVGNAVSSETARRVAGYLNATKDKDGNPIYGRVKTFEQEDQVTEKQAKLQQKIAQVYESLPDNDLKNPRVRKAYAELAREVLRQFKALPVKIEVMNGQGEPYKNSDAMRRDLLENNHLYIYGTTPDTFGPPGADFTGHPLLANSGLKDQNGYPLLFNDLLRAVHDYYAHAMTPTQFGPRGEEAAWKNHMSMTSNPWARWALTSETRGQNSWVNFRPDLDADTPISDRPFARQKAVLLPAEYALTGNRAVDKSMKDFIDSLPADQRIGTKPDVKASAARQDYRDSIDPEEAMGRIVTQDVEIEDTGKTGKLSVDAGKSLADYNQRVDAMKQLLGCLHK